MVPSFYLAPFCPEILAGALDIDKALGEIRKILIGLLLLSGAL